MKALKNLARPLPAAACILGLMMLAACAPNQPATLCHATGDPANPYELVTITGTEDAVHLQHPNDFGPAPAGGCPSTLAVVTDGKIMICHAPSDSAQGYEELPVSAYGLDGHATHPADLIPAPEGGCPTGPVPTTTVPNEQGKITICHATGSAKNPYVLITIDMNGLNGHQQHAGDIIPAPADGCPRP